MDEGSLNALAPTPAGRTVAEILISSAQRGSADARRVYRAAHDPVTLQEASLILGCSLARVQRHIDGARLDGGGEHESGGLAREIVETLAAEVYAWRLRPNEPTPYWLTAQRAAVVLGISRSRLGQLAAESKIPHLRHQDGTRLYRRHQLEAMAASSVSGRVRQAKLGPERDDHDHIDEGGILDAPHFPTASSAEGTLSSTDPASYSATSTSRSNENC